jgi:hypothetical protein
MTENNDRLCYICRLRFPVEAVKTAGGRLYCADCCPSAASCGHCAWCADPFRAVLLDVTRRGARQSVTARHYGLPVTTVGNIVRQAWERGCLAIPVCRYCPTEVTRVGAACSAKACVNAYGRDNMRQRRARLGTGGKGGHHPLLEAEGFTWPELPPCERTRTPRKAPVVLLPPPVKYPARLVGKGWGETAGPVPPAMAVWRPAPTTGRRGTPPPPLAPTLGSAWDPRWRRAS